MAAYPPAMPEPGAPAPANPHADAPEPAGPDGEMIDFTTWRAQLRAALETGGATDVPCAGCTACCRSSQFVLIEPDEADTLAHIPPGLLAPAPGRPPGHVVMGYDGDGCCPMLGDEGCGIYDHRPRTCRTYDCRVFAATGVVPDQPLVAERVARWRFSEDDLSSTRRRAEELLAAGRLPIAAALRAALGPGGEG